MEGDLWLRFFDSWRLGCCGWFFCGLFSGKVGGEIMVLYLEALKKNCEGYIQLGLLVKSLICNDEGLTDAIDSGTGIAGMNLEVIDRLLGAGITEVKVPEV